LEILDISGVLSVSADRRTYPANFARFLGTAGTRFVMLSQRRASGGIWFSYGGARGVIDPGPGSLARICAADPPLSALDINTLLLTHRHIDHSSDLNVLAEGMTLRAREPRGLAILTRDSLDEGDAVLLKYARKKIKRVKFHKDGKRRKLRPGTTVESVLHEHHGVECYGLVFRSDGLPTWGLIGDTAALPSFPDRYRDCELLIVNVALPLPRGRIDHMSLTDLTSLLQKLRPKLALMTHMGGHLLDMGPERVAPTLATRDSKVVPARDGMIVSLEQGE
jgi:phosphoribosyl 1,2-cyclic phosphodiesterase